MGERGAFGRPAHFGPMMVRIKREALRLTVSTLSAEALPKGTGASAGAALDSAEPRANTSPYEGRSETHEISGPGWRGSYGRFSYRSRHGLDEGVQAAIVGPNGKSLDAEAHSWYSTNNDGHSPPIRYLYYGLVAGANPSSRSPTSTRSTKSLNSLSVAL